MSREQRRLAHSGRKNRGLRLAAAANRIMKTPAGLCAALLVALFMVIGCGEATDSTSAIIPARPSPSPSPAHLGSGPVKGLSDNPAFQWWRWPGGAQPDSWWGAAQTPDTLRTQTDLMKQLGVKLFRVELVWAFVEPTMPGGSVYDSEQARSPSWNGYQWDRWDMIVDVASAAGLQVVPEVYYTPSWADGVRLSIDGGPNAPPKSPDYYGDFMHALVERYHDRIHFWELGNEPDYGPRAWTGTLTQYVQLMLEPGYKAVKEVDSTARVLLAGLAGDTHMNAMYKAGAGPYFDIASVHAYYSAAAGDSTALDHVRAAMLANGDGGKPIWLTEFGMATRDADTPTARTQESSEAEQQQARLIHDVYAGLRADAIFFYQLRDTAVYGASGPIKYVYWGLVSRDFSEKKPGLAAFMNAASPDITG